MYGIDDVRTEVRKIANSKPVHAAAGAGALATQTIRDLPGRIARSVDGTVTSLPGRASKYVQTARARAAGQYDLLADRGKEVLGGRNGASGTNALNGTASTTKASTSRAGTSRAGASKARTTKDK